MSEGQPSPLEQFVKVKLGEHTSLASYGEYGVLQTRVDGGTTFVAGPNRELMQAHAEAAQKYGANAVVVGTIERAVKKLEETDKMDPDKVAEAIIAEVPNIGKKVKDRAKLYGSDVQIAEGYGEVLLLKEAMLAHTLLVVSEHRKAGEEIPQPLRENLSFVLGSMVSDGGKGEPMIDWNNVFGKKVLDEVDFKELAVAAVVTVGVAKVGFDLLKKVMVRETAPEIPAEPELTIDRVKGLSFEEAHSLIVMGTDKGKPLGSAIETALFARRKDLVDAAKKAGLLDLYPARITGALRDAGCTWKTFDRVLAERAEAAERESQGISGYRPEFKGLVREAIEGLIPLAELQGWEKADAAQRANHNIDAAMLTRLKERVVRETVWDLGGKDLAAYIDEGPAVASVPAGPAMGVRAEFAGAAGSARETLNLTRAYGVSAPDYFFESGRFERQVAANPMMGLEASPQHGFLDLALLVPGDALYEGFLAREKARLNLGGQQDLVAAAGGLAEINRFGRLYEAAKRVSLFAVLGKSEENPINLTPDNMADVLEFDQTNGSKITNALLEYLGEAGHGTPKGFLVYNLTPTEMAQFRERMQTKYGKAEEGVAFTIGVAMGIFVLSPQAEANFIGGDRRNPRDKKDITNPLFVGHAYDVMKSPWIGEYAGSFLDQKNVLRGSGVDVSLREVLESSGNRGADLVSGLRRMNPSALVGYWKRMEGLRQLDKKLTRSRLGIPLGEVPPSHVFMGDNYTMAWVAATLWQANDAVVLTKEQVVQVFAKCGKSTSWLLNKLPDLKP